ncbi:MAG: alpha-tubulin suppressor-like RCC1 family protein [Myxococcota bacterium]|jgi:alpha-tubulin suppressor-like RCC1 family protein
MWTWFIVTSLAGPVVAGAGHSCTIVGGAALCWGGLSDVAARRGDVPTTPRPVRIEGVHTAAGIAAGGGTRSCAITEAGQVQCWSLGVAPATLPLTNITQVSVGDRHACAVDGAGQAWCWGDNHRGQLGDGTTTASEQPVAVPGIADAAHIAAGWYHTCAVLRTGRVTCWGDDSHGQLGHGHQGELVPSPTPALYLEDAAKVYAGQFHTCALRRAGALVCWGSNLSGQLGDGTRDSASVVTAVRGIDDAVALSVGMDFACAIRAGGQLVCWGSNERGQQGQPDSKDGLLPRRSEAPPLASVSCGAQHTCGTDFRGGPWCWGQNFAGQLGDGGRETRRQPAKVDLGL